MKSKSKEIMKKYKRINECNAMHTHQLSQTHKYYEESGEQNGIVIRIRMGVPKLIKSNGNKSEHLTRLDTQHPSTLQAKT